MRFRPSKLQSWLLLIGLAVLAAAVFGLASLRGGPKGEVGLFTTLPLLWSESADVAELVKPAEAPHWARLAIEREGRIAPLDTLAAPRLARLDRLVLAQPRPLSPEENVALDQWVRGGGKLLLLADPMLTEPSRFPLGDRRRPQDTVLISPILAHWGIELMFDETRPSVEADANVMGVEVPVLLHGTFRLRPEARGCRLWAEGSALSCAIGKGRLVALADAAVLERNDPEGRRAVAFDWLLDTAFAAN